MSDSTPAPREHKTTSYETLKKLEVNRKRQINRRGNQSFDIKLKVIEVANKKGRLGDSTATINFIANNDVVLANEQTYDISGSLKIEDFKLTLVVEAAQPSETKISSVGTDSLSTQLLDPHSIKPLVNIKALLENKIGQSFFAKLLNISAGEEKVVAVLADLTGKIDAEIQLNKKYITEKVLSSLVENQTYLCSDVALQFTAENKLIVKFNYRSSISPVEIAIPTFGSLNLSENVYSQEQKEKLQETLKHKEKSATSSNQVNERNRNPRGNPLQSHELVTIDKLEPWNNNQSFIGKILSVNTVKNNEYKNLTFFKGQVGDSTGVIDFDFIQKSGQTLNVNDVVKFERVMNKGKDGRHSQHYVEIKRFGSYTVLSDVTISSINTGNNMSTKDLPTRPEKPAGSRPFQTEGIVKINQLVIGNNRQSTVGKILNVIEETRTTAKGQNLQHLVGQIADETGAVDFDIIKQGDSTFKTGDIVELDRVINRAVSGKHVVILHLGKYTVSSSNKIQKVNTNIIPLHRSHHNNNRNTHANNNNNHQQSQGNNIQSNSGQRRQNNRSESNQEGHQHKRRDNTNNNTNYANPRQSNRTNGEDQRRQHNNENKNESNTQSNHGRSRTQGRSQQETNYKPRNQSENNQGNQIRSRRDQGNHDNNEHQRVPLEYSKIKTLRPGSNGQNFVGKVFELQEVTRDISGKSVTFLKGRVGDDSGNIAFDFSQRDKVEIHNNDVVVFKNIMNKVDDNGYHFITIGKFGQAHLARHKNIGTVNTEDGDSNLSSIEYIKKTIPV